MCTPILCLLGSFLYNRFFLMWFIREEVLGSRFSHKILGYAMGVGWELQLSTTHMFYRICRICPDSAYLISGSRFSRIFPDFSGIGPFLGLADFSGFSMIRKCDNPPPSPPPTNIKCAQKAGKDGSLALIPPIHGLGELKKKTSEKSCFSCIWGAEVRSRLGYPSPPGVG